MIIPKICIMILFGGLFTFASADTLYLKNGRSLDGFVEKEEKGNVYFKVNGGTVEFKNTEIARVYKSVPEESALIYDKWERDKEGFRLNRSHAETERVRRLEEWQDKEVVVPERQTAQEEPVPKGIDVNKKNGHFFVDAVLNDNVSVTLLLDTGASMVLISRRVAEDLGIKTDNIVATIDLSMADGRKVKAKRVTLKSVRIKNVEAKDVSAAVFNEDSGGMGTEDGLLGMSFLSRFDFRIDQDNNKLILKETK